MPPCHFVLQHEINFSLALATIPVHAAISEADLKANSAKGLRLLSLEEGSEPVWKTDEEKLDLMRACVKFFDITDVYEANKHVDSLAGSFTPSATYPPPSHQRAVKAIIRNISRSNMQRYLSSLASFNNRYYKSPSGAAAADWVLKTVGEIAKKFPTSKATVKPFNHITFPQRSIIATIPGTSAGPVTILGAHIDSINLSNRMDGRAPGADDDGSGSVNLMEAFRTLLEAGFRPKTPVEFHWYAGEEEGLLGSQQIALSYRLANKQVKAMMQLDMTAYAKPGTREVVGLISDFVDPSLTKFVGSLIDTYSNIPWVTTKCGYGCSDHASWNRLGYPSAFPFETDFGDDNPEIHGSTDTTDVKGFSWSHTLEFTKVAVAFAYELGM